MAGRVLTIAQQKGGAGKSTLAVNLAVAWARAGHTTALVDIDPQGSTARWAEVRATDPALEDSGLSATVITGWRTTNQVKRLADENDVVVIDSPPHAETDAKLAIRAADTVVVPMQPGPADLWATAPTLDIATAEKRPCLIVLNRVPPRGKLVERIVAEVEAMDRANLGVAAARIGNRIAFASAFAEGKGVLESEPRGQAAAEIKALADELLG